MLAETRMDLGLHGVPYLLRALLVVTCLANALYQCMQLNAAETVWIPLTISQMFLLKR